MSYRIAPVPITFTVILLLQACSNVQMLFLRRFAATKHCG